MKQQVRGKGTKDDPNIVKSLAGEYRMVGCHCTEDETHIKWFWLYNDQPKRCQCGYWFKLEPIQNGPEVGHLPA